jgi:hypothetical protein
VSRPTRPKCGVAGCRRLSVAQCDYQLEAYSAVRTGGGPAVCNMQICEEHRLCASPSENLCPFHAHAHHRQLPLFGRRTSERR